MSLHNTHSPSPFVYKATKSITNKLCCSFLLENIVYVMATSGIKGLGEIGIITKKKSLGLKPGSSKFS